MYDTEIGPVDPEIIYLKGLFFKNNESRTYSLRAKQERHEVSTCI